MSASALAAALLLPACGADGGDGGGGASPPPPAVDLRLQFFPEGREPGGESATLQCDPAGGTHPRPEEACAALAEHPEALEPVPPDAVCTQIYGGDQAAVVEGTFRGPEIEASFDRTNGCEIARWDALAPLLELTD